VEPRALAAREEEQLVLPDRSTELRAEVEQAGGDARVSEGGVLPQGGGVDVVAGQPLPGRSRLEEPLVTVPSRAPDGVEYRSRECAILGRRPRAQDLDLLEGVVA